MALHTTVLNKSVISFLIPKCKGLEFGVFIVVHAAIFDTSI